MTTTIDAGFTTRLKSALLGRTDVPLVFLGNFEVEQQWARGELTLPRVSAAGGNAVVNRMDEFALLLAGPDDHVVLKTAPDSAYLEYLAGLGIALPTVHVVRHQDPQRTVTEDVLEDPELLRVLAGLGAAGARLTAHGVSEVEELLADRTGVALAAPDAVTCKAVNSKTYSRRLADELGLRQPTGWACDTVGDLEGAFAGAAELIRAGHRVVVKEAFGVSGKGIAVLDSERRADRLHRMIVAEAAGAYADRIAFVVEDWVAKRSDLNYQFTVGHDGTVRFDFVKEAITEAGVHKGHRMPPRLSRAQVDHIRECASAIGGRLAADGYYGVVGVDALVEDDGALYPVIEINARNNMSTYQVPAQETFVADGQVAMARHYPLRLSAPLSFGTVREVLAGLLVASAGGSGLLVNNFATVNAGARLGERPDGTFDGRLYGLVIADSTADLDAVDAEVTARLADLEGDAR
jgi:hypothetical protein